MDQSKTGKFIAQMRKEQKLTQRQLADKLMISDKTISKWETGKGLPEISLMIPLCEELNINVNELLSGERIKKEDYSMKAEENMMKLLEEKRESKKKIILSVVVAIMMIIAAVPLIVISGQLKMEIWLRILLICIGLLVIIAGIAVACILDRDAGAFECPHCKTRFVPGIKSYMMAPHTVTKRKLTCPNCGKKSYCKHRLTK